jgi:hypothetical protein
LRDAEQRTKLICQVLSSDAPLATISANPTFQRHTAALRTEWARWMMIEAAWQAL